MDRKYKQRCKQDVTTEKYFRFDKYDFYSIYTCILLFVVVCLFIHLCEDAYLNQTRDYGILRTYLRTYTHACTCARLALRINHVIINYYHVIYVKSSCAGCKRIACCTVCVGTMTTTTPTGSSVLGDIAIRNKRKSTRRALSTQYIHTVYTYVHAHTHTHIHTYS